MTSDLPRDLLALASQSLAQVPAVVLLGPRQVGKTTLAMQLAQAGVLEGHPFIYLDLESERDRSKLTQPEQYLSDHLDKLVILDEVQRSPNLFPVLRGLIDQSRRAGRRAGMYLLLGSAGIELLKQSGETLAGRVTYLELSPLSVLETSDIAQDTLWLRGGFPDSLLARTERQSLRWRQDFIRTYLEREIAQYLPHGMRISSLALRQIWTMLAHLQGGMLNMAQLSRNVGLDVRTLNHYVSLLVELLLVRRLTPWHANVGKRLIKSPKVYLRDSGLVHALLDIESKESLLSHPVLGASWEGFVIENLLNVLPKHAQASYYRSVAGAEIDLLVTWPGGKEGVRHWAIEVKRSLTPKVERGFHEACSDLAPERRFVVYPGSENYGLGQGIEVVSLAWLCQQVQSG